MATVALRLMANAVLPVHDGAQRHVRDVASGDCVALLGGVHDAADCDSAPATVPVVRVDGDDVSSTATSTAANTTSVPWQHCAPDYAPERGDTATYARELVLDDGTRTLVVEATVAHSGDDGNDGNDTPTCAYEAQLYAAVHNVFATGAGAGGAHSDDDDSDDDAHQRFATVPDLCEPIWLEASAVTRGDWVACDVMHGVRRRRRWDSDTHAALPCALAAAQHVARVAHGAALDALVASLHGAPTRCCATWRRLVATLWCALGGTCAVDAAAVRVRVPTLRVRIAGDDAAHVTRVRAALQCVAEGVRDALGVRMVVDTLRYIAPIGSVGGGGGKDDGNSLPAQVRWRHAPAARPSRCQLVFALLADACAARGDACGAVPVTDLYARFVAHDAHGAHRGVPYDDVTHWRDSAWTCLCATLDELSRATWGLVHITCGASTSARATPCALGVQRAARGSALAAHVALTERGRAMMASRSANLGETNGDNAAAATDAVTQLAVSLSADALREEHGGAARDVRRWLAHVECADALLDVQRQRCAAVAAEWLETSANNERERRDPHALERFALCRGGLYVRRRDVGNHHHHHGQRRALPAYVWKRVRRATTVRLCAPDRDTRIVHMALATPAAAHVTAVDGVLVLLDTDARPIAPRALADAWSDSGESGDAGDDAPSWQFATYERINDDDDDNDNDGSTAVGKRKQTTG